MGMRMGPVAIVIAAAMTLSACGQLTGGGDDERVDLTSREDGGNGDQGEVSASTVDGSSDGGADGTGDGSGDETTSTTDNGSSGFCPGPTERIVFAEGAFDGSVNGMLDAGGQAFHPIEVADDQLMTIGLSSRGGATFDLVEPGGKTIVGGFTDLEVTETSAGDYGICVTGSDSGTTDYSLTVTAIWNNTPTTVDASWCGDVVNDRGEIKFDPGAFAGTVENAVIRGERDLYRVGAGAGQFLFTELSSLENNAVFTLRDPDGLIIVDEVSDFRIPLAATGDYEFCVGGTRGNATYLLYVEIS